MPHNEYHINELIKEVYHKTDVLRRPISGIVSGYHELPYILVAPDNEEAAGTVRITGKINVSPRFIISPSQLAETFGDVFDSSTFDRDLQGRIFSFAVSRRKNIKVDSEQFEIRNFEEKPQAHLDRVQDELLRQENVRTGLIFGPRFDYYPVSVDRFVNEVLDREFKV